MRAVLETSKRSMCVSEVYYMLPSCETYRRKRRTNAVHFDLKKRFRVLATWVLLVTVNVCIHLWH